MIQVKSLTINTCEQSTEQKPAQFDMLKQTYTLNILHLETSTTESMDSLYSLCTVQQLKELSQPYFSNLFLHPFHAIIVIQINILSTPLSALKTIEFMKTLEI